MANRNVIRSRSLSGNRSDEGLGVLMERLSGSTRLLRQRKGKNGVARVFLAFLSSIALRCRSSSLRAPELQQVVGQSD